MKRISHTEGRARRERLLRGVRKRAAALLKELRTTVPQRGGRGRRSATDAELEERISDALYLEACRAEGRERNWRKR